MIRVRFRPVIAAVALFAAACSPSEETKLPVAAAGGSPQPAAAAKRVPLGNNVVLEIEGTKKRVLVETKVCLRSGTLEQLLTRKRTKEHEAILVGDVDGAVIHTGLILCGAEVGSPVKFQPKYEPPRGTAIKITLEFIDNGKTIRRPAQEWIRDVKSKKDLALNWVFAGSRLFPDPDDDKKPPYYLANDGDLICVSNFDTALLDLPIDSNSDNEQLTFEAHTERIPTIGTPVTLILEPVPTKKDAKRP